MRISDWSSDVCSSDLLQVIADSLDKHHGSLIGQLRLSGLLQAVSIFGFHLATVDLRQSSDVHERVLTELFGSQSQLQEPACGLSQAVRGREHRIAAPGNSERPSSGIAMDSIHGRNGKRNGDIAHG